MPLHIPALEAKEASPVRFATGSFVLSALLVLSACGTPKGSGQDRALPARVGTTGYVDPKDGQPYVHNGDEYVEKQRQLLDQGQEDAPPAPPSPSTAKPAKKTSTHLRDRVREFEISRFKAGEPTSSRFGADCYQIKVFFRAERPAVFEGSLSKKGEGQFALTPDTSTCLRPLQPNERRVKALQLTGDLTDKKDATIGLFVLKSKRSTIEISYNAFRRSVVMRHDSDQQVTQGSTLEKFLTKMCDPNIQVVNKCKSTFGWVNNWSVVDGPSFQLTDFYRELKADEPMPTAYVPPAFSIKGASKATSRVVKKDDGTLETELVEVPAQSSSPDIKDVKMWANSETGGRRSFDVELAGESKSELTVDLVNDQETPDEKLTVEETPIVTGQEGDLDAGGEDDDVLAVEEQAPAAPQAAQPARPVTPRATVPNANPAVTIAFIATDMSSARPAKFIRDLNRNKDIPDVQRLIRRFQDGDRKLVSLRNFFIYGYWARGYAKAIGKAYDVSPAFMYLSVNESEYLRTPNYTAATGDGGRAVGPFQIHPPAASDMKLPVAHRRFFVPSACGAARYISGFTQTFNGDNTVAILAYNQGGGTASKLVASYRRRASKQGYTYADMASLGGIPQHMKDYVNKYLAVYFISSNMKFYGFDPNVRGARTSPPTNGSLVPSGGISDPTCRAAVASMR